MDAIAPHFPILAIAGIAILTFLYTVAKEIESRVGVIELRIEVKRLQDQFARRRAAAEAGASAQVLDLDDQIEAETIVIDPGLGGSAADGQARAA